MIDKESLKEEIRKKVLGRYGLPSKERGLTKILDTWERNKGPLMELLSKHPNWNPEKFQIAFDTDVEREVDITKIKDFFEEVKFVLSSCDWSDTLQKLRCYDKTYVDGVLAELAKIDYPQLRITPGQKTSKAVNKILKHLGVDELLGTYNDRGVSKNTYDRDFAKYADAINPLKIIRHTVISCHPADYFLASNGNSWSSCHTINKHDSDTGYSGCYCSGTLSYMLDGTSMVFYHVDKSYEGNELELQPKIIRQMFHYSNGVLVQGRLYPKNNDGKNSLYVSTRAIMQKIFADCLGEPNIWRKKGGVTTCEKFTVSYGTHYRDYTNYEDCNVSRILSLIPEGEDKRIVRIGHIPICPICGGEHERAAWLYCCGDYSGHGEYEQHICRNCGRVIDDEEEVYWIDGEPYCEDCVVVCDECGEYVSRDNATYLEETGLYICDECRRNNFTDCDCGHMCRDPVVDVHGNTYCSECAEDYLTFFNGEYYPNDEVNCCSECGQLFIGEEDLCPDCRKEVENECE